MKINQKYQEEFSNYLAIMNEALSRGDFKAYDVANCMLNESIEDCKHDDALRSEMDTNNFGVLNHILESQLVSLIKGNKKAVKRVITAIREDNNLKGQFAFYEAVKRGYNNNASSLMEADEMLKKVIGITSKMIDKKTLKESNKKFKTIMEECGIVPNEFIDEEDKKLYESCDFILRKEATTSNIIPLAESYKVVTDYMERHKKDKIDEGKDFDTLINDFEKSLKNNLNESEMSFVKEITDFRSPMAEKRKMKLFDKLKMECIEKVNAMIKEDSDNDELKNLKRQLEEQTFSNETIVKDVAKLLEIRDILMDD